VKPTQSSSCAATVILLLSLCFSPRTWAATVSLNPSADAFVTTGPSGNLANNNYGGGGALSVAAQGLAQGEFQSLLQFGLSTARNSFDSQFGAGQWSIQSVSLQLTAAPPNNGVFNASTAGQFSLSLMLNNAWTEGTGTPSAPTTTGITFSTLNSFVSATDESLGIFGFSGATSGATTYALNLTPTLSEDILTGSVASLRMFAADNTVSYLFDSRSFNTASAHPLLNITAVPEAGALVLNVCGFGLLAGCRLRFRKARK